MSSLGLRVSAYKIVLLGAPDEKKPMLFAAEGGGFFSSSASGYSKGLTLLFLSQKKKEDNKPMRVSPWNHYQLVDQGPDTDLQLASLKHPFSCGCASFVCFGRASAGLDNPSPLKVGPAQPHSVVAGSFVSDKGKELATHSNDHSDDAKIFALKSSLKKQSVTIQVPPEGVDEHYSQGEKYSYLPEHVERRKVQWPDACGSELAEIKEFEPSELAGSDDEFQNGSGRSCMCSIM